MSFIAVLTGDIVNSTALPQPEVARAIGALEASMGTIAQWPSDSPTSATSHGATAFAQQAGDGWQAVIESPHYALRAALTLRANLMGAGPFQTRISVAVAKSTQPVDSTRDPNTSLGPAFTASGRLLAKLPKESLMQHSKGGAISACFTMADHISQGWTQAQAQAVALALDPVSLRQQDIAQKLGITRQAVGQALKAAGFGSLKLALSQIEHGR